MGDFPSGSELLYLCPVFSSSRAGQLFFLKFSKDDPADNKNEFTYMVVWPNKQGYCKDVFVSPVAWCHSVIASFNQTCKGFLKLVTSFLIQWCMHSSMR